MKDKVKAVARLGQDRPVHGYGLTIYAAPGGQTCAMMDHSPVLVPVRAELTPNGRRLRFAEGSRELRQLGDIFVADIEMAGFVREAINEKLAREAA
jgi:hypothetical protein